MFYLEKCAVEDCNRKGRVAVEEGDVVCNLHRDRQARVKVQLKKKEDTGEEN